MKQAPLRTRRTWLRTIAFLVLISGLVPGIGASEPDSSRQSFGPRIIPIQYDELFELEEPPPYDPFPMYGAFFFSVAKQQLPMVYDTELELPDHIEKFSDVVYKQVDAMALGLDVYVDRSDPSPNPLILIIHGGYWKAGDKGRFYTQRATEFVNLGYTVASINYRLSTTDPFPANIEDLRDGLLFLTERAEEFRLDPTRIMTYGISAGGHLAAFLALAANSDRAYTRGLTPSSIRGAISLYGIHDLTLTVQRENPFTELYIGEPYALNSQSYIDASTIEHVDEHDPPILLIHGTLDGSVSVRNSDNLARALEASNVPFVYDRIEGWPHLMDFFSPIGERSLWRIHRFLEEHMPSEEMSGRLAVKDETRHSTRTPRISGRGSCAQQSNKSPDHASSLEAPGSTQTEDRTLAERTGLPH